MQVSHSADHITHALIGGGQTIEFQMASSAALMQVFSSTLYSNQPLAVAREVLCNAWDAHIRAGITDKPIEVTITDSKICVLDQAFGIAPAMMGPLYGTYGGTDKVNNGLETGGFGFGCKAPFAYNDHFEVVSCHLGTKTIYNISKSSADKHGKSGITPIVALPTTETGLQVAIPLKDRRDQRLFIELFNRVARNGEMNVEINGAKVETLPLSEAETNWLITSDYIENSQVHRVYVRYGNVIYPIKNHDDYRHKYQNILNFLEQLNNNGERYNIIFQAKPNTIAVTPSRESLSMQEHTIKTIIDLLNGFIEEKLDEKIAKESEALLDRQIRKAVELRQIGDLMRDEKILPGLRAGSVNLKMIRNSAELAAQFTKKIYPRSEAFYKRDMGLRIDAAIELGIGHRGHLNQVKYEILTTPRQLFTYQVEVRRTKDWFNKRILRPLFRDLQADPVMEIKRLFITIDSSTEHFRDPCTIHYRHFGDYLPILRKVVVLSFSKKDIWQRIKNNKEVLAYGEAKNVWFYHAPVSKTKIQAIRDFFTTRGFILVDFTSEENWSKFKTVQSYVPVADRIVKPKLAGFPALSGVNVGNKTIRVDNCFNEGVPRVSNPLFFLKIIYSKADYRPLTLGNFTGDAAHILSKLFGDVCAVIRTEPQEKKLKEAGLSQLNEYVIDYVCDKVVNSPSFQAYWPECINRGHDKKDGEVDNKLMMTLFDINEVRTLFGLTSILNDHDRMVRSIWQNIIENGVFNWRHSKELPKITTTQDLIKAMPVSSIIIDIASKEKKRDLSNVLNLRKIQEILQQPDAKLDGHLDWLAKLTQALLS